MKYYSQYRSHDLFELQESLSGLSKSNRWVKLVDHLPWDRIEKEYNKVINGNIEYQNCHSKSIETFDRNCLTLGVLGWGTNSNNNQTL